MNTAILIQTHNGRMLLHPETILRIEGLENYSKVFFQTGRPLVVSKTLVWFEERLPATTFSRIHRSHIVNKTFITEIVASKQSVLLSNGEYISISRRKKSSVLKEIREQKVDQKGCLQAASTPSPIAKKTVFKPTANPAFFSILSK